jgi:chemotaxis protein CheZ
MSEHNKLDADEAFARLGLITRQLHQAMAELGYDAHLHRIAREIPDARERLTYVGKMTEDAAHKVLGLVDDARPACLSLRDEGRAHQAALAALPTDGLAGPVAARLTAARDFAARAEAVATRQAEVLGEIMLAQDFQDLSGQVIKKAIDIISRTETQLLQLLSQSAPQHLAVAAAAANEQLQGPQTPEKALKQDDVDDLLSSLGF